MKDGPLTYRYIRHLNGRTRYGAVTIRIVKSDSSKVTDKCEWTTLKEAYPDFVELPILKLWKETAVKAATELLATRFFHDNIEVILMDVMGLYIDTVPSQIGAAMYMGIFDYCEKPLGPDNLKILDDFVDKNRDTWTLPVFSGLLCGK